MTIKQNDFKYLNREFKDAAPHEIIRWCIENLVPDLAMMSSFQISGMVILDLLRQESYKIPLFFIDTGYHFPETIEFRDKIIQEFGLDITSVKPVTSRDDFEKKHGKELYKTNPDFCCSINKIEPHERALKDFGYHHWISGIRKDQSPARANNEIFMHDGNGGIRVHPLLNWKRDDVWNYIKENNIPYHPLYDFGYSSIGCSPETCTSLGSSSDDERSGRWKNFSKTECGLHNELSIDNNNDINRAS